MKKFLLLILLIFGINSVAYAGTPMIGGGVQERVIQLPEDGGKWYVTIHGQPGEPQYENLRGWFNQDQTLTKFRSQCRYYEIPSNSQVYQQRYAQYTEGLPCVRVQDSSGYKVYSAAGSQLPVSPQATANAISQSIEAWRSNGRCRPQPAPAPSPAPAPFTPAPAPVIDPPVMPEPADEGLNPLFAILAILLGGGYSGVNMWKQEYFNVR